MTPSKKRQRERSRSYRVGVMQRNSRYRSAPLVQIVDQVSPLPHSLLQSPQQLISNDS
ncbi:hypothetical protein EMIT051CA3_70124 [Pseudomonas chlororaphis]